MASSVVLLAGCGGSSPTRTKAAPRIPAAVAQLLAADADAVAAQSGCAAHLAATKLLDDVIANVRRIPARYREPLTSAANELAARVPDCAQPAQKPKPDERSKHGPPKKGHKKPPKHPREKH